MPLETQRLKTISDEEDFSGEDTENEMDNVITKDISSALPKRGPSKPARQADCGFTHIQGKGEGGSRRKKVLDVDVDLVII